MSEKDKGVIPEAEELTSDVPVVEIPEEEKYDEAGYKALVAKLRKENKENEKAVKRLAALEEEDKKRKDAELSELEKERQEKAALLNQINTYKRRELQNDVASEIGLPAVLASRIQGDNKEDMIEDAKTLLAAIPAKVPPKTDPTNPGGLQTQETDAERRKRLGL